MKTKLNSVIEAADGYNFLTGMRYEDKPSIDNLRAIDIAYKFLTGADNKTIDLVKTLSILQRRMY